MEEYERGLSFAVTACNEHKELDRLLGILTKFTDGDNRCEIVVLVDSTSVTVEVDSVINKYLPNIQRYGVYTLNKDFASFKNYLNSLCTKTWILQLDADEYPHEFLLGNIFNILYEARDIDAIWIPRVNTVEGLTDADIAKWGWNVNSNGWINFPDNQLRLYKNRPEIKWEKPVHEQLVGYTTWSTLPYAEEFSLIHHKDIARQRRQNEFYDTI